MVKDIKTTVFKCVVVAFLTLTVLQSVSHAQRTSVDCRYPYFNLQGSSNADVTVSSSVVAVLIGTADNCAALITNSGTASMRCTDQGLTPSSTVGTLLTAGQTLVLAFESARTWSCIRTTSTDTTANVTEVRVK